MCRRPSWHRRLAGVFALLKIQKDRPRDANGKTLPALVYFRSCHAIDCNERTRMHPFRYADFSGVGPLFQAQNDEKRKSLVLLFIGHTDFRSVRIRSATPQSSTSLFREFLVLPPEPIKFFLTQFFEVEQ